MNQDGDDDDFIEAMNSSDDSGVPSREELAVWLSDFMSQSQKANNLYRSHLCSMVVNKVWSEFGVEGMCELMMAIDKRAGWISDILLEDADLHDSLFNSYGVFDNEAIVKARMSNELIEMNRKIWRLRRKYTKLIAEEIYKNEKQDDSGETSSDEPN